MGSCHPELASFSSRHILSEGLFSSLLELITKKEESHIIERIQYILIVYTIVLFMYVYGQECGLRTAKKKSLISNCAIESRDSIEELIR